MIQKDGSILLADWHKGISQSPFMGFADMRSVENTLVPGVLMLGKANSKKSGTIITGSPRWFVQDTDTNLTVYLVDTAGKVYNSAQTWTSWAQVAGNTTTGTYLGCGLAIWKDYLFVARDTNLDVYGPLSGTPAWTNGWQTLNSSPFHMMFTSVDDKLYICNGRNIASLTELTSFLPGTGATYTWNASSITLPTGKIAKCISELGANLYFGTVSGKSPYGINQLIKTANIFPYSRSSLTLGIPIQLQEFGINQMIAVNTELIIQAGNTGKFYKSNGSYFYPFTQIPRNTILGTPYLWNFNSPGGIMYHKNKIFTGVQGSQNMSGVYSFNIDGSGMILESATSSGELVNLDIGALIAVRDQPETYLIGWADTDSAAQGVDKVGADDFVASYGAYVDSQVYEVGTSLNPKTFQEMEFCLDRPLATNEGVRLSYREDLSASFSLHTTFDFTTYSSKQYIRLPFGIKAKQIQFRVALTGTTTSPRLKYIIIR